MQMPRSFSVVKATADCADPPNGLCHICRILNEIRGLMLTGHWMATLGRLLYPYLQTFRRSTLVKILIITGATVAMVTAAAAADLPHPQPVPAYPAAQVGKMPVGKSPIGKTPIGKAPPPVVSKY
jgi:hypothetical protein